MESDERLERLREIARGERELAELAELGIVYERTERGIRVHTPPGLLVELRLEDAAESLVRLSPRFQDLAEWSTFVLAGPVSIELDERFGTTREGDAILGGIWDAAFGSRPSRKSLAAARRVVEGRRSRALRGWTSAAHALWVAGGALAGCLLIAAALARAGGGHGSWFPAKLWFPYAMTLAAARRWIGVAASALALLQFPVYGWILSTGLERGKFWRFLGWLVLAHLAAAWIALHVGGEVFPT